jgi:succinate dehydrogenase hydrophobic anchor subunit
MSPIAIALSITGVILVIFIVLLIIYYNKNKKNSYEDVLVERKEVETSKPKKKVKRNEH